MPVFELNTRLVWGWDAFHRLPEEIARIGRRPLVVVGSSAAGTGLQEKLDSLCKDNLGEVFIAGKGEPDLAMVNRGVATGRLFQPDLLVGIGGGSVMDTAKALAALIPNPGAVEEYFYGRALKEPPLPVIAVPTLFGSGAEVSFNAVLLDTKTMTKQSLRDPRLLPRTAVVDPELGRTAPQEPVVYAALDGLTQGIEAFVSRQANFFSDLFAREAVVRFGQALAGINRGLPLQEVLADLAYGSTCGGVAMAAARLGAVHGLAHPVGVFYGQPHGKVCASLLPAFMRFNLPAAAGKYAVLTAALGIEAYGDELDKAAALVKFIITLNRKLGIPLSWRDLGVKKEDFPELVEKSLPSGSLQANPRPVGREDLFKILEENW
ncbi:MAG TPA: iron-containing alcohol dehydrogenase [Firmicutes bacterium]|nr:iron-containing alcohol dehydrogenase [Bacillota bacterium]